MSLVLLDNVFSSLDRRTAVSILFRLCGEDGFFREEGTTVVLTSYLRKFCMSKSSYFLMLTHMKQPRSSTLLTNCSFLMAMAISQLTKVPAGTPHGPNMLKA